MKRIEFEDDDGNRYTLQIDQGVPQIYKGGEKDFFVELFHRYDNEETELNTIEFLIEHPIIDSLSDQLATLVLEAIVARFAALDTEDEYIAHLIIERVCDADPYIYGMQEGDQPRQSNWIRDYRHHVSDIKEAIEP